MVRPGSPTKIISFIKEDMTIKKILEHCGKWKEPIPGPPPQIVIEPAAVAEDVTLDYDFPFDNLSACFEQNCV